MMKEEKHREINQILKDLYYSASKQNFWLDSNVVYNYLIQHGVSNNPNNRYVNKNFFGRWQSRFKDVDNIDVFVSPHWKYFCQFKNGSVDYDCVKMYIPLDYEHIYEGVNLIFDFLARSNIAHMSKIGSHVRFDDVVVRLNSVEDAKALQFFIDNNSYIQSGLMKANPFAFSKNKVSYAYDGVLSYNSCMASIISEYINDRLGKKFNIDSINVNDFIVYLSEYSKNNDRISCLGGYERETSIGYAKMVVELLKLSLVSNKFSDYNSFFASAGMVDKERLTRRIINNDVLYDDKEQLFNEFILTTMKKYPKGFDAENPEYCGFDYISTYISGNIRGVTRDDNLRERISQDLSVQDIYAIVNRSGIVGNNVDEKLWNYVKMVMLNEVIRCMSLRMPENFMGNLYTFLRSNNFSQITNSVGNARRLCYTMDASMMKEFLQTLGVRDISEYISNYYDYNQNIGMRR